MLPKDWRTRENATKVHRAATVSKDRKYLQKVIDIRLNILTLSVLHWGCYTAPLALSASCRGSAASAPGGQEEENFSFLAAGKTCSLRLPAEDAQLAPSWGGSAALVPGAQEEEQVSILVARRR